MKRTTRKLVNDRDALAALFGWYRRHGRDRCEIPQDKTRDALLGARDRGWLYGDDKALFVTQHGIDALRPYGVRAA